MQRQFRFVSIGLIAIVIALMMVWPWRSAPPPGDLVSGELEFKLIDGNRIRAADLRGRVVLIDFWATSCAICIAEMPDLQASYQALKGSGLEVIAVAMPYDRPDHVLHFVRAKELNLKVALDIDASVLTALGPVPGTPTRVLISRAGRIAQRWIGALPASQLHQALVEELAREAPLARVEPLNRARQMAF